MVPTWPSNTDLPLTQLSSRPWDGVAIIVCDSTVPFLGPGRFLVGIWQCEIWARRLPPVPLHHENALAIPKVSGTTDNTFVQQCGDATHEIASCYTQHPRLNQEPFSSSSFIRPSDMRECWLLRWWGSEQNQSMSVTSRGDGNWTHVFQRVFLPNFQGTPLKENRHTPFETKSSPPPTSHIPPRILSGLFFVILYCHVINVTAFFPPD